MSVNARAGKNDVRPKIGPDPDLFNRFPAMLLAQRELATARLGKLGRGTRHLEPLGVADRNVVRGADFDEPRNGRFAWDDPSVSRAKIFRRPWV